MTTRATSRLRRLSERIDLILVSIDAVLDEGAAATLAADTDAKSHGRRRARTRP